MTSDEEYLRRHFEKSYTIAKPTVTDNKTFENTTATDNHINTTDSKIKVHAVNMRMSLNPFQSKQLSSSNPWTNNFSFKESLELCIREVVKWVRQNRNLRHSNLNFLLIGISWGGLVALECIKRRILTPKSVLLLAPAIELDLFWGGNWFLSSVMQYPTFQFGGDS